MSRPRRIRRLACAVLLGATLATLGSLPARAQDDTDGWRLALSSELERQGDTEALARAWLAYVASAAARPEGDDSADAAPVELFLERLRDVIWTVGDAEGLIGPLETLTSAEALDGRARSIARDLLATLYRRTRTREELDRLDQERGYVLDWAVLGPFGTGARSQLARGYEPEWTLELDRAYRGDRGRELHWQRVERLRPERHMSARYVFGGADGIFYHLAQVRSPAARRGFVQLESIDPVWLDVNGHSVARETLDERLGSPRRYAVTLREGWNRLLLKSQGSSFALLLTDAESNPLEDVESERSLTLHDAAAGNEPSIDERSRTPVPFAWETRLDEMIRRLEAAGDAEPAESGGRMADALLAAAILFDSHARDDLAQESTRRALASVSDAAFAHYHDGRLLLQASYLPAAHAQRRARAAFERAVELDDGLLPARLELAKLLRGDGQPVEALQAARDILALQPRLLAAHELVLELYEELGWETEALAEARAIESLAPWSPAPHAYRASRAEALRDIPGAVTHYTAMFERRRWRSDLLQTLAGLEQRRGRIDEARRLYEAWREDRPDAGSVTFTVARFLLDVGDTEEALALLTARAERYPRDARGVQTLAESLEEIGRRAEAIEAYHRYLELRPGDLQTRRYVDGLERRPRDRFWEAFDERLEEWLPRVPPAERFPEAGSLAVLDIAVLKIWPDGSTSEYTHQALRLLDEGARENLAHVQTPGEIHLLRSVLADGTTLEPVPATGSSRFVMPGLAPGVTVEFAYTRDSPDFDAWMFDHGSFYFQDFTYRQPVLLSRYAVILPESFDVDIVERALESSDERFARVERREEALGDGWRAVVYEAKDVQRLEPEAFMPPYDDSIPHVSVIERRGWDLVADELADRVAQRAQLTPELRGFARDVVGDETDPLEKTRALYRAVNERLKSDRGPGTAIGALLENAGDRGVLFKALLDAAGVRSHWAFARPREGIASRLDTLHPRPGEFAERIVVVETPGQPEQWVSLEARHLPFGALPTPYQGGQAIVLKPGGAALVSVPYRPREESLETADFAITLGTVEADPLAALVRMRMVSPSEQSYAQKPVIADLDAHRRSVVLQRMASQLFPGARLRSGELPNIDALGVPLEIALELVAPRYLQRAGDEVLLRPVPSPANMVRNYVRTPQRTHPYELRGESGRQDRFAIEVGATYRVVRVPPPTALVSPLGSYSLRFVERPGGLDVERLLELRPGRLELAEFPAFLEFCRTIDEAEGARVVLARRAEPSTE